MDTLMAYTQADIDKLKAALASGVLTVRTGENSVTYQSMADLAKQIERMQNEVDATNGKTVSRRSVASYSSGLY
jgi:hypothetical protein